MINIFYASIQKELNDDVLKHYVDQLPSFLRRKISAYKRWQDVQASLFGKLLLRDGLKALGLSGDLNFVQFSVNHRPYINACFDFNITHAGGFVMCAFSSGGRIGIDLEFRRQIDVAQLKNLFTAQEWSNLVISKFDLELFYDYWTMKEAVAKGDGRGMYLSFKDIAVDNLFCDLDDSRWLIQKVEFDDNYSLHVATDKHYAVEIELHHVQY